MSALLNAVFGPSSWGEMKVASTAQLKEIVQKAYQWNNKVKSTSINVDYNPRIAENGALFDDPSMHLEKNTRKPEYIVCSSNSGLETSVALGGGILPKCQWQERIRVILNQ